MLPLLYVMQKLCGVTCSLLDQQTGLREYNNKTVLLENIEKFHQYNSIHAENDPRPNMSETEDSSRQDCNRCTRCFHW